MIISVAHSKGGVGKTTLALNLADQLKPDIIIDLDTHQSLAIINNLRDKKLPVLLCNNKKQIIDLLKQSDEGKIVLVDCGGFDSEFNRIAIAASDIVITPANDDLTELIGLRRFDEMIEEINSLTNEQIKVHVVFNRVHPSRTNFGEVQDFLSHSKNLKQMKSVIARRKEYPLAASKGYAVTELTSTKHSSAAKEIKNLFTEIKTKLNTI